MMRRHFYMMLLLAAVACGVVRAELIREVPHGRLERLNGCLVVTVDGSPTEMGTAYGTLLKPTIQRVVQAMITDGIAREPAHRERLLTASAEMAKAQPERFLTELRAVAKAAEVDADELLLLQYFGDVERVLPYEAQPAQCTSFAILPPRSEDGHVLVGRNFDYFDAGVGDYASLLAVYRPTGRHAFVTVTWAGVLNGWTLMNDAGIVVSNNTGFGSRDDSLEGVSTCNLLRLVAEDCGTLAEAIETVETSARACGTIMLVASGKEKDAAILEYDHSAIAVRRPTDGFVGAANRLHALYQDPADADMPRAPDTRLDNAERLVQAAETCTFADNPAGTDGVPIQVMNLHSVTIDATDLRIRVAMGAIPAYREPYYAFRFVDTRLVADPAANLPARPKPAADQ